MTPEAQRIAIAKYCHPEYSQYEPEYWYTQRDDNERDLVWKTTKNNGLTIESVVLPDYLNDLNAMHKAVAWLRGHNRFDYITYADRLNRMVAIANGNCERGIFTCDASADLRAEAFLKAIGRWTE
jgi:hypothetical protein